MFNLWQYWGLWENVEKWHVSIDPSSHQVVVQRVVNSFYNHANFSALTKPHSTFLWLIYVAQWLRFSILLHRFSCTGMQLVHSQWIRLRFGIPTYCCSGKILGSLFLERLFPRSGSFFHVGRKVSPRVRRVPLFATPLKKIHGTRPAYFFPRRAVSQESAELDHARCHK